MIDKPSSLPLDAPQVYTDLSALQQLKNGDADRNSKLEGVAEQFEAMLLQMMLKSMRQANAAFSEGDPLNSSEAQFYQEMFDSQLSVSLAQGRGIGIAAALIRQLQGKYGDEAAAAAQATVAQSVSALRNHGARARAASAQSFDGTPAAFVAALYPQAEQVAQQLGVDSRVLLSQAALETGWGRKVLTRADGASSFNFFNIKADPSWRGAVVQVPTVEYRDGVAVREQASFRAYNSPAESFADYARLIGENPRYRAALDNAGDSDAYVKALAAAGYATDPRYAEKVLAVLGSEHLQQTPAPVPAGTGQ